MTIFFIMIFALGLVFGSFANVCISRIPRNESIVKPSSHCPKCEEPIKWFDNIPIVSYILLSAKCRKCGNKISIQYPLIELISGITFLLTALYFKISLALPLYLAFTIILIIISVIDYYHMIIPDSLSFAILLIGIIGCFVGVTEGATLKSRLINSFIGVIAGGGILYSVGVFGNFLFHKETMGGGDIKLLAAMGAVLGWTRIFPVLFIASLIGSIIGIALMFSKKIERAGYIPFGPFLAVGAFVNIFIPNPMIFVNLLFGLVHCPGIHNTP
jgi:leader peptidase (prepilin peptidase) / N-methyltransferase